MFYLSIEVSVDAVTGCVTSYRVYSPAPEPRAIRFTRGDARALAEDWFQKLVPAELRPALRLLPWSRGVLDLNDGMFHPDGPATAADLARWIARTRGLQPDPAADFRSMGAGGGARPAAGRFRSGVLLRRGLPGRHHAARGFCRGGEPATGN